MGPDASRQEAALRAELEQANEKLGNLTRDLRAIDGELDALATERKHYALLRDACAAL